MVKTLLQYRIPGSGRSPGEGNGSPLQYSCLENSMDRGAWWATVHGVAKSQAWLSNYHAHVVTKSCPALCDPMDCSTPGFPVLHHLPELAQIHVHWVGDAIQSSHPLSSPSPFVFNLSQDQGLFQWVGSSPKYCSFSFSINPSKNIQGWFSWCWRRLLRVPWTAWR